MYSIPHAAAEANWKGCALALVAALEELPRARALEVAAGLVELVRDHARGMLQHKGARAFLTRSIESLEIAEGMDDPDRLIALASAVHDAVSGVVFPLAYKAQKRIQHRGKTGEGIDFNKPWHDRERHLWQDVHEFLSHQPELKDSVGRGHYRPGRAHEFAAHAAEIGIL
jgi:hypothetical protein